MPELPEVETVVRELQPKISGKTLHRILIKWHKTVSGDNNEFQEAIEGRIITNVSRRGKYICLNLDSHDCVTIHLRMTGKLVFAPGEKEDKHIRSQFYFTDGTILYFIDSRKFGRIKLWRHREPFLPQLGPEPLNKENVSAALLGLNSLRAIKTVLLDQTILAGIGNIYADEALFMAGIHPLTPAGKLPKTRIKALSLHIPQILNQAIENKGTTISDYRNTDQSRGENQHYLNIYGRENKPCQVCDTTIKRITINNRSAHFCPKCQRKRILR
jgi:formamidopyrimidine-DNA glycosylase